MLNIDHLKPFGYKYYGYVDLKSLPANKRIDKLMMPSWLGVFIGYFKERFKLNYVVNPDLLDIILYNSLFSYLLYSKLYY